MTNDIKMSDELRRLIDSAKLHKMTPEERHQQMLSFVWGNMPHENNATRQEIAREVDKRTA